MIEEKEFLKWIIASDKTLTYKYGEPKKDGTKPDVGQRFLTPRELAELRLRELVSGEKQK